MGTETPTEGNRIADKQADDHDVIVVGGGVSGLTAGLFTARAGLETLIVSTGDPILRRNAHLENYPGFPAGVNSRLFLDMVRDQAERAGCSFLDGRVTRITDEGTRFEVSLESDRVLAATRVIAASWADSSYLESLPVELDRRGSKQYVGVDENGRTAVDGLYAAGRIAGRYHQTVVAAGHGAQVGLTLIHDSDVPFYHDWVAPAGYFTGRGRDVPPGCEEIDAEERLARERESIDVMRSYFERPHPDEPTPHPSLIDD